MLRDVQVREAPVRVVRPQAWNWPSVLCLSVQWPETIHLLIEKARHLAMQSTQELMGEIDVIKRKHSPCRIPVMSTERKQLGRQIYVSFRAKGL